MGNEHADSIHSHSIKRHIYFDNYSRTFSGFQMLYSNVTNMSEEKKIKMEIL